MCVCEVQAKDGPLPPWISRPSAWGRRLLLRPCQGRVQPTAVAGALVLVLVGSWGGGPALSLMWAALRACVVVLDCLIRGPAAAG